ncbi:MAG: hypothetical protein NC324_08295, partial [Bacteroides sp.]|nr:hypothetical protein [Bacteroides sp.]
KSTFHFYRLLLLYKTENLHFIASKTPSGEPFPRQKQRAKVQKFADKQKSAMENVPRFPFHTSALSRK